MNTILGELGKSPKFCEYIKNIENKTSPIAISGLTDVGMAQMIAATNEFSKKPVCIITYNEIQAKKIIEDLRYFADKVIFFPKKEIVTYDYVAESKDLPYERIEAINKIQESKQNIVVTTIEAVMQKIISKEQLYKNIIKLKIGETYNLEEIKQKLVDLGYVRCDLIEGRGQFSIRGGIVDISTTEKTGIRVEFWGDEVDSIRNFNIISQRSTDNIQKATINPAHEYVLEDDIQKIISNIKNTIYDEKMQQQVEQDIEAIKGGNYISKIDRYFNAFYKTQNTILDYITDKYIVVLDEINKIEQRLKNVNIDANNVIKTLIEKEKIAPDALKILLNHEEFEEKLVQKQLIYIEKFDNVNKNQAERYEWNYKEKSFYKSEIEILFKDLLKAQKDKNKIYILADTKEKAKKLCTLLDENQIINKFEEKLDKTIIVKNNENFVTVSIGKLSSGYECFDLKQLVITAEELVEGEKRKKYKNSAFKEGEKVVFADLKLGDYVVHQNYGIGIFIGVNTISADGTTKDYIKLKYAGEDILYVPTNQLDSIRKYVGGDEGSLKINKLGSKEWINTKSRVKKNLRQVAEELIELYAKREEAKGYAFPVDTPWQTQFEEKFPHQETDDQLRCIDEVKKDMELNKPMDRLLCGDVGYGKTEVAIRAAFKAVMGGKQVAYLAPTTVLAQQQFNEFKERMSEFAIRVEVLNRFRTQKEQTQIVRKLKLGEVDIVVGTHRILSEDIEFKDLGLLIIDEEHRFGVKAKEKIKRYKTNIDVLTMTATPIPRTLHMSIVGVRDMSVIYEPPYNRKPVQTYVLEYDQEVIKEAITREIERKGQVFYLFNNVERIREKANEISKLIPEAKVVYAHGRMSGNEIEDIMQDFINKNTDILVCTTILESGIDIPNANTIIVENADRMGLAQLYQIRGRVGRSDRQGYAYITYKRDKLLSEVADKRLKAIKEFTEFGSGFKIAMRDLEIRGAGSLLGEIQHGHLEQVGYDTYCKLLDEVIQEMKGAKVEEEIQVQIDLDVTSYIPDEYISDSSQKIEIYQNIALCKTEKDILDVIDEIIDRFGNMPNEIENLIEVARIKTLCRELKISKVQNKNNFVLFIFEPTELNINIQEIVKKYKNRVKFTQGIKPQITLSLENKSEIKMLYEIKEFLQFINQKEEVCK
ncbi:MAG: transcription-repair coupling factor [Clostridia bacterium]|nr:transcription-repair coupling factor [Clostridia bacterium]